MFGFEGKWTVEIKDQFPHASSLPYFPDVPGHVKEHGLEEQHKTYPLVIILVLYIINTLFEIRDTRIRCVPACLSIDTIG